MNALDLRLELYVLSSKTGTLRPVGPDDIVVADTQIYLRLSKPDLSNVLSDPSWGILTLKNKDVGLSCNIDSFAPHICRLRGELDSRLRNNCLFTRMDSGYYKQNQQDHYFVELEPHNAALVTLTKFTYSTHEHERYLVLKLLPKARGWSHVRFSLHVSIDLVGGQRYLGSIVINHNQRRARTEHGVQYRATLSSPIMYASSSDQETTPAISIAATVPTSTEIESSQNLIETRAVLSGSPLTAAWTSIEDQLIQISSDTIVGRSLVSLPYGETHWMKSIVFDRLHVQSPYMECIRHTLACKTALNEVKHGDLQLLKIANTFFKKVVTALWEVKLNYRSRVMSGTTVDRAQDDNDNEDLLLCLALIPELFHDHHHMSTRPCLALMSEILNRRALVSSLDHTRASRMSHPSMPYIIISRFWLEFTDCLIAFHPMELAYGKIIAEVDLAVLPSSTRSLVEVVFHSITGTLELWNAVVYAATLDPCPPSMIASLEGHIASMLDQFLGIMALFRTTIGPEFAPSSLFIIPEASLLNLRLTFRATTKRTPDRDARDRILAIISAQFEVRDKLAIDMLTHLAIVAAECGEEEVETQVQCIRMFKHVDPYLVGRGGFFLRLLYGVSTVVPSAGARRDPLSFRRPWATLGYVGLMRRYRQSETDYTANASSRSRGNTS